ncbi:hypothetical protein GCM10017774_57870 [Lentzea cavernae]|uniref:Uncharacterized protein n=1 Tax=Lentzea cavernae TaxID=2020703 RepID=A0ABQ3MLA1_9PSEU|nr:hypothetical protein GCM10017774_57870 [Lentzea cavernae]
MTRPPPDTRPLPADLAVAADEAEHLASFLDDNDFTPPTGLGCGCVPAFREEPPKAPQPTVPNHLFTAERVPRQRIAPSGDAAVR